MSKISEAYDTLEEIKNIDGYLHYTFKGDIDDLSKPIKVVFSGGKDKSGTKLPDRPEKFEVFQEPHRKNIISNIKDNFSAAEKSKNHNYKNKKKADYNLLMESLKNEKGYIEYYASSNITRKELNGTKSAFMYVSFHKADKTENPILKTTFILDLIGSSPEEIDANLKEQYNGYIKKLDSLFRKHEQSYAQGKKKIEPDTTTIQQSQTSSFNSPHKFKDGSENTGRSTAV